MHLKTNVVALEDQKVSLFLDNIKQKRPLYTAATICARFGLALFVIECQAQKMH
jgi:hypothetical protein